MIKYLAVLGVLTLTACTTPVAGEDSGASYAPITFAGQKASDAERKLCEAAAGEVTRIGRIGNEACVQNLPDAGKTCSDASDCIGRCVLETDLSEPVPGTSTDGICEATDNQFGCTTLITDGKIEGTLCID